MTSRKQLTNNTNKLDNNKDEVVRFKKEQYMKKKSDETKKTAMNAMENAFYSGITHILLSVIALYVCVCVFFLL